MASKNNFTSKTPSISWFKNVSKSLGYTSSELITQMTPATIGFVGTNANTVKDVLREMRTMKSSDKKFMASLLDKMDAGEQAALAGTAFKNAISDIKSGKLYNKERQESLYDDGTDFSMGDFDFDSGDDFDVSTKSQSDDGKTTNVIQISSNITKDNPMVHAINLNTQMQIKAQQENTKANISISTKNMVMNRRMHEGVMKGLDAINTNLSLLVNFQSESMTKYIGASLKYYEDNLKIMNDTLSELRKTSSQPDQSKPFEDVRDSIFLSGGGLDLSGYTKMISKQLNKTIESNMFLSPLKSMFQDKDTLKYLAASPLSFISTKLVTTLMPTLLTESMKGFDKTFSNFFPAALLKVNRLRERGGNPLLGILSDIFGINTKGGGAPDLSKYNKGPVPFDGYTRQSIVHTIPTYLRKILAAVSGKEEMAYDYEKGQFRKVDVMKKEYEQTKSNAVRNSFSESMDEMKDRLNAFDIKNTAERERVEQTIDKFFKTLSNQKHLVKPQLYKDKNGRVIDELGEMMQFRSTSEKELLRGLILSLPKSQQMKMFGTELLDARAAKERLKIDMENNHSKYNAASILGWDEKDIDSDLIKDKRTNEVIKMRKRQGGIIGADERGMTSNDYLRDIKKILLKGIMVYPQGNVRGRGGSYEQPAHISSMLNDMDMKDHKLKTEEEKRLRSKFRIKDVTDAEKANKLSQGIMVTESLDDLDYSGSQFQSHIENYVKNRDGIKNAPDQNGGLFKWMGKYAKGDKGERYEMIRSSVKSILQKPASILTGIVRSADNVLYEMIFGKKEGDTSVMSTLISKMKTTFDTFNTWMKDTIYYPMKEMLFGKEGLMTKIKNSSAFQNAKGKFNSWVDFIFGAKDVEGIRSGSLFSSTGNELKDMFSSFSYYFTGKAYKNTKGMSFPENKNSVFGEVKSMFTSVKTGFKEYMFGRKGETDKDVGEKGVVSSFLLNLKAGFQNFSDAMFGPKTIRDKQNKNYIDIDALTAKVKERAPKALAAGIVGGGAGLLLGGKLGLLGALLLPGGPIGGAVVGVATGFLSQSDKFKDWLFGPMAKNEKGELERVGGFISKKSMKFMKDNRAGIIGGATVGAAKSILGIGLLPSFLLPGGPIGGALMGMGVSLGMRSEAFQKFMFGPKDPETQLRSGGVVDKLFGKFRDGKNKNLFGNIAAGSLGGAGLGLVVSKLGLMGAMLTPAGPLGGALLGAAAGIAISSDKWKKILFGEFDEDTQLRKGGLFGKFINWTKMEIFQPLKLKFAEINLNIQEWFAKSIANPFLNALEPIKHEIKLTVQNMKEAVTAGFKHFTGFLGDMFERIIGQPFGRFMEEKVMKPLKSFMSKMLGTIGKVIGTVVSAPFKGAEAFSRGLTKKHMDQGLDAYVMEGWKDVLDFRGRRERGEKMGFFGGMKKIGGLYFNQEKRNEARYGEKGAPYAAEMEADIARRKAETDAKFSKKRAAHDRLRNQYNLRRNAAKGADYENIVVDENGVEHDVSGMYGMSARQRSRGNSNTAQTPDVINLGGDVQSNSGATVSKKALSERGNKNKAVTPDVINLGGTVPEQESGSGSSSTSATVSDKATRGRKVGTLSESNKKNLLDSIASDVKIIAQEVKGQLDGVGSNVFKTRKLIQKMVGGTDDDMKGEANRDRSGFFGNMRKALYKPMDFLKEQMLKPIKFIGDKLGGFIEKAKAAGKALLSIPKVVGKAIWDFSKGVGKAALEIVKLPGYLFKALNTGLQIVLEGFKAIAPALGESLKGIASMFGGVLKGLGYAAAGAGVSLYESAKGFGKGVGELLEGFGTAFGSLIGSLGKGFTKVLGLVGNTLLEGTKAIMSATMQTTKFVGKALADTAKGFLTLMTTPFALLGRGIAKITGRDKPNKVEISGGTIDSVKVVEHIGSSKLPTGSTGVRPLDVRIVGSTIPIGAAPAGSGNVGSNSAFLSALRTFDDENDKEEDNKSKARIAKDKIMEKFNNARRKTASYMIAEKSALAEKAKQNTFMSSMMNLVGGIKKGGDEHRSNWMQVFGLKGGLITAGVLLALPFMKKIYDWVKGFMDGNGGLPGMAGGLVETVLNAGERQNSPGRQDVDADADGKPDHVVSGSYRESLAKGGLRAYEKNVKMLKKHGKGAWEFGKGAKDYWNTRNPEKAAARKAKHDARVGKVGLVYDKYKDWRQTHGPKPKIKLSSAAEATVKAAEGKGNILQKLLEVMKVSLKKMMETKDMQKLFGKTGGKVVGKIMETLAKVFTKSVVARFSGKIIKGFVKAGLKVVGAVVTGSISAWVFAAWDATTGATDGETANLFNINQKDLDWKMKLISGAVKVLFGINPIFDVANQIVKEAFNENFKKSIAEWLYAAISPEADEQKLKQSQGNFKSELEQYNKENGTKLNMQGYNDKMNQSAWQKIANPFKKVGSGIKNAFIKSKDFLGGVKDKAVGNFKMGVKGTILGAKIIGNKIGSSFENMKKYAKRQMSDDNIRKVLGMTKDEEVTLKDRVEMAVGTQAQFMTFGLVKADAATKFMGNMTDNIQSMTGKTVDGVKNLVSGIFHKPTKEEIQKVANHPLTKLALKTGNAMAEFSPVGLFKNIKRFMGDEKTIREEMGLGEKEKVSISDRLKYSIGKSIENITLGFVKIDEVFNFVKDITKIIDDTIKVPINFVKSGLKKITDYFNKTSDKNIQKSLDNWQSGGAIKDIRQNIKVDIPGGTGSSQGGFGEDSGSDMLNNFVYYKQGDPRWGKMDYSFSPGKPGKAKVPTISARGCGPTSMAMVAAQLTGKPYQPQDMANLSKAMGTSSDHGTDWAFYPNAAKKLGLNTQIRGTDVASIRGILANGNPVILSGKRNGVPEDKSPFTDKGHFVVAIKTNGDEVLINDPRGPAYSKAYKWSDVTKGLRGSWGFSKGNKEPEILPDNPIDPAISPSTLQSQGPDLLEMFTQLFTNFGSNVLFGTSTRLDWGDIMNGDNSQSSMNIYAPGMNSIMGKLMSLTVGNEGAYNSFNNDKDGSSGRTIGPSLGILQWHGNRIKNVMTRMYQLMPNDAEAKYFATEADYDPRAPWSATKLSRMRKFLSKNSAIAQRVQKEIAEKDIRDTNLRPVYEYGVNANKIKDPRAIVFMADFANTGPANVKKFFSNYTPTANLGAGEFDAFLQQFKTKSYWAGKSIYANRINKTEAALRNWTPTEGGLGDMMDGINKVIDPNGCEGGLGEITKNLNTTLNNVMTEDGRVKAGGIDFTSLNGKSDIRTLMNGSGKDSVTSDALLKKAIDVLEEIATHTSSTSKGIDGLSKNPIIVDVNGNPTKTVVVSHSSETNNTNTVKGATQQRQNNKQVREYNTAKRIAAGQV